MKPSTILIIIGAIAIAVYLYIKQPKIAPLAQPGSTFAQPQIGARTTAQGQQFAKNNLTGLTGLANSLASLFRGSGGGSSGGASGGAGVSLPSPKGAETFPNTSSKPNTSTGGLGGGGNTLGGSTDIYNLATQGETYPGEASVPDFTQPIVTGTNDYFGQGASFQPIDITVPAIDNFNTIDPIDNSNGRVWDFGSSDFNLLDYTSLTPSVVDDSSLQ